MDIKEFKEVLKALQEVQATLNPQPEKPQPEPKPEITVEQAKKLDQTMQNAAAGNLLGVLAQMVGSGYPGLEKQAQAAQNFAQNTLMNAAQKRESSTVVPDAPAPETGVPALEPSAVEPDQGQPPAQQTTEPHKKEESQDSMLLDPEEKDRQLAETGNFSSALLRLPFWS